MNRTLHQDEDDEIQEVTSKGQPIKIKTRQDSSEDDMPIMVTRQRRTHIQDGDDRPSICQLEKQKEHSLTRQIPRSSPALSNPQATKPTSKPKKPSPTAWTSKPIIKNDLVAKKALISEITSYWGPNFITSYIPKQYRPLVKRGIHGKRSIYRSHENDAMKWLPSVLKAILMIAKITKNKEELHKTMNEVVRYRIRHTGNRKPQLVTTDFDVIEDMLDKRWEVGYAFEIRYKHLLVNRKEQLGSEEDIDHIFSVRSSPEDVSEGGEGDADCEMGGEGEDSEASLDGAYHSHHAASEKFQQASSYNDSHEMSPALLRSKESKAPKQTSIKDESSNLMLPPRLLPHYGYGPPTGQWGLPMHAYNSYAGWDNCFNNPGYGASQFSKNAYRGPQPPPSYGMFPLFTIRLALANPHSGMYPLSYNCLPQLSPRSFHQPLTSPPIRIPESDYPKVKREPSPSPSSSTTSNNMHNHALNHSGPVAQGASTDDPSFNDEWDSDDAELAAAEAELKVARLRAAKKAKEAARRQ